MAKSASHRKTKKGRHRASRNAIIAFGLPQELSRRIDRWRRENGTKTRAEAIRRLIEQALGTDPARQPTREAAAKASDLAGRAIDRLADPSVAEEEQGKRKRRLIKGPREFRSIRRDPASN
jgi:metal-responsive CopG/Arc/MetJ family transcriptional regulator